MLEKGETDPGLQTLPYCTCRCSKIQQSQKDFLIQECHKKPCAVQTFPKTVYPAWFVHTSLPDAVMLWPGNRSSLISAESRCF